MSGRLIECCALLGILVVAAAFASVGNAGDVSDGPPADVAKGAKVEQPVLRSISEMAQHFGRKDIESLPIELSVRVNYWDCRDERVFIEDASSACFLKVSAEHFERHPQLRPGTRLHVIGRLSLAGRHVEADSIEAFVDFRRPSVKFIKMHELQLGQWWSYQIKTLGVIEEVAQYGHRWMALVSSGETSFVVRRFDSIHRESDWPNLIGRVVRIRGTLACETDHRGNPTRFLVRTNEFDSKLTAARDGDTAVDWAVAAGVVNEARLMEQAKSIPQAIETSLQWLRQIDPSTVGLYRIHGQITSAVDNEGYLIESGGHGVFVRSALATKASLGHVVDLTVRHSGPNEFKLLTLNSKGVHPIPPAPLHDGESIDADSLPHRATIEAELVSSRSDGAKRLVKLRKGGTEFVAMLDADGDSWRNISLDNARRVAVSGMVIPAPTDAFDSQDDAEPAYVVELKGAEDLQVLSRWWQFSPSSAITALTLFSTVCAAGMICFAILWLKVQRADRTNRRLMSQLMQSQKMDAIGRLAGGVAHDFNNLLAGIGSNLELLDRPEDCSPSQREQCLASARRCTVQATKLVRSLLGFSRQERLEMEVGDINQAVEDAALLAETSIGPDVEIALDLDPSLPPCRFDHAQLEQVFLNLCFNARDALHLRSGTIHICTECETDEDGNRFAQICVRDFGQGMSRETVARVFDPFFTTKPVGEGTGLGLALAYGVVKQHGGTIECESELGVGSEFTITLPAVSPSADADSDSVADSGLGGIEIVHNQDDLPRVPSARVPSARVPSARVPSASTPSANASPAATVQTSGAAVKRSEPAGDRSWDVLLIDDDDEVRRVATLSLEALGHRVTSLTSGRDAIRFLGRGHQPDLVILDLIMPGLSGSNTFCQLKTMRPELPIVICSGLVSEIENLTRLSGRHPEATLSKPFQLADLQATLDEVMLQTSPS